MTEYCSGFKLYDIVKICWEYYDSPYYKIISTLNVCFANVGLGFKIK
jgi:hypothetical protein